MALTTSQLTAPSASAISPLNNDWLTAAKNVNAAAPGGLINSKADAPVNAIAGTVGKNDANYAVGNTSVADKYTTAPAAAVNNNSGAGYTANTMQTPVSAYGTGTAKANTAGVADWSVSNNQTVQDQLASILAKNSPLQNLAAADAMSAANSRGLINSTMAINAGQDAVLRSALPIAQADAATYANAAHTNAAAKNTASLQDAQLGTQVSLANTAATDQAKRDAFIQEQARLKANQDANNVASQFGANASNSASAQNAQLGTQVGLANAAATDQAARDKFNADQQANVIKSQQTQDAMLAKAATDNQLKTQQAQLDTQTALANNAQANDVNKFNSAQANDLAKTQNEREIKVSLANADNNMKMLMSQSDASTKEMLTNLDGNIRKAIQGSASAANMYNSLLQEMSAIQVSPDLNKDGKQSAIDNLVKSHGVAIQALGDIANIPNISYLVNSTPGNGLTLQSSKAA